LYSNWYLVISLEPVSNGSFLLRKERKKEMGEVTAAGESSVVVGRAVEEVHAVGAQQAW
jgi:hypothetical protein